MINVLTIEPAFEKRLAELPFFRQVAFAYALAKRNLPYYLRFSEQENFGDPQICQVATELLKKIAVEEQIWAEEIETLLPQLVQNMPDTEEFGSVESSLALDVCGLLFEALSSILEQDRTRLASIAYIPLATADFRTRAEALDHENLILSEMQFQEELFEKLGLETIEANFWE